MAGYPLVCVRLGDRGRVPVGERSRFGIGFGVGDRDAVRAHFRPELSVAGIQSGHHPRVVRLDRGLVAEVGFNLLGQAAIC
jgi:hypothetical protein